MAAGKAKRLAGFAIGFTGVIRARCDSTDTIVRDYLALGDAGLAGQDFAAFSAPRANWAGFDLAKTAPLIMGVVNVTPDSFSDGGDHADIAAAIRHGRRLAEEGADILDIGGESTRPGARPVTPEIEAARILPVIAALAGDGHKISVDTRHASVMAAALAAGASIVNDVTALAGDPAAVDCVAESDAALLLMHMQGDPQTMQKAPHYRDATLDLLDFFAERLAILAARGIAADRIALDPGIGFGKTDRHNLQLIEDLAAFHVFGRPLALGVSRKGLIGRLSRGEAPKERLAGSLALAQRAFDRGLAIIRVHDVAATFQARALWRAGSE